jgi:GTP pyrophosphokinase
MDWRDQVADAEEFVESLKSDVFQEMIYVFTPAGDIIELPAGATPVDFAYRSTPRSGTDASARRPTTSSSRWIPAFRTARSSAS